MGRSVRQSLVVVVAGCLLLALWACGGDDGEDESVGATGTSTTAGSGGPDTYVGTIEGTDIAVATLVEGDDVLFYVCDGSNGRRVDGRLADGRFETEIDGMGAVAIEVTDDGVSGSVTADGDEYAIEAAPAVDDAAFLWAEGVNEQGEAASVGWVVAPDGSETGGVVAGITDGTSNTIRFTTGAPSSAPGNQSQIIAVLIGVRAPITALR